MDQDGKNHSTVMIISIVEQAFVDRAFAHVVQFLKNAVERAHGEITIDDVRESCLSGDMQLWAVFTSEPKFYGAAVTQIVKYPQFDAMRIVLLGGKQFDEWKGSLDKEIELAARKAGCQRVEAFGRTGFVRSLQGLGYNKLYMAIGKELKPLCLSPVE